MTKKISVVLPCLNESKNLPLLVDEICRSIPKKYDYEIICVDDGSTDGTDLIIESLGEKNKKIKGIILYKRSGHQEALRVGIENSTGDAVITMDADFQHPPSLIPKFLDQWESGHDLVQGQKKDDQFSSSWMKLKRKIGYFLWEKITGALIIPGVSDFRLMDKAVVKWINKSTEREIFLRGLAPLASKNPTRVYYDVEKRRFGKSSYNFSMFLDMFVNGVISFSTKPIRIAWIAGILIILVTGSYLFIDIVTAIINKKVIIEGWETIVILILLLNGFIIFYLAILGEYIGVIFKETKRRTKSIVISTVNLKK